MTVTGANSEVVACNNVDSYKAMRDQTHMSARLCIRACTHGLRSAPARPDATSSSYKTRSDKTTLDTEP